MVEYVFSLASCPTDPTPLDRLQVIDTMHACILQDRFAIGRYLPPVDESQDWFLVSGVEENGYTILEFRREFTTCDDKDLTIKVAASPFHCLVMQYL